jgi:hypothetical protein
VTDHSDKALGRLPRRIDDRTLRLARYLTPELPAPPAHLDYASAVPSWPMYGNDALGDCFWAMIGHLIQADTAAAGSIVTLPEDAIVSAYSACTGYRPSDPSTDQGTVMLDGMNYWRHTGVGGHKIVAYAAVNPRNDREVRAAMTIFGGLCVGANMPITAQRQHTWTAGRGERGAPGSWGGHAIPNVGYRKSAGPYLTPSWGDLLAMTRGFMHRYVDELYAAVTEDFINRQGMTPQGLNLQQMLDDLHAVTG